MQRCCVGFMVGPNKHIVLLRVYNSSVQFFNEVFRLGNIRQNINRPYVFSENILNEAIANFVSLIGIMIGRKNWNAVSIVLTCSSNSVVAIPIACPFSDMCPIKNLLLEKLSIFPTGFWVLHRKVDRPKMPKKISLISAIRKLNYHDYQLEFICQDPNHELYTCRKFRYLIFSRLASQPWWDLHVSKYET